MEILAFWIIIAGATTIIASSKGRSGFGWFVLGFLFSLVALIVVCAMPAVNGANR